MTQIGTAYVVVEPDLSQLQRKVGPVAQQLSRQLSQQISGSMESGHNAALKAMVSKQRETLGELTRLGKRAMLGVTGAAAAGAVAGVKLNAQWESVNASFKTFLGNAKAAKKFTEELRTVSRKSPLRLTEYAEAARMLLGYGVAAKKVVPLLQEVNKAVVATGGGAEEMQRVTLALGQMQAKGKASAEELRQLAEAGVPVNKILQRELHLTGEEVAEIGKHGVKAEDAIAAIARGWHKQYGAAYKDAQHTFSFQMANLRKTFEQALRLATEPLFDLLRKRVMPRVSKELQGFVDILNDPKLTGSEKIARLREEFNRLREEIGRLHLGQKALDLLNKWLPVIANKVSDAAAKIAPKAAEAFVKGWIGANIWTRLLVGGWLMHKLGGFAAMRVLGARAGTQFAAGMATTAGAGVVAGSARGAAAGAAVGRGGRLLGMGRTAGAATAGLLGGPVGISAAAALLVGPEFIKPFLRDNKSMADSIKEIDAQARKASGGNMELYRNKLREIARDAKNAGTSIDRDLGRKIEEVAERATNALGPKWIGQIRANFKALAHIPKATMPQIARVVQNNTQIIKDRLGKDSDAGRKALATNFRLAAKAVKQSMDEGAISTADGTARIRTYLIRALESLGLSHGQAEGRLSRTDKHGNAIGPAQDPTSRAPGGGMGRRQRGGPITTGKPSGDSVPSLLERGEYVLNREAVKRVGVNVLDRINFQHAPRFQKGGGVDIPRVTVRSDLGMVSKLAQRAVDIDRDAALEVLRARAAAAAAAGGGGGETSTTGLVGQVLRALAWARGHGWHGSVTSGFRSSAQQAVLYARYMAGTGNRAAPPGSSSHEKGQAVDVTDTEGFARAMASAPPGAHLLRLVPGEPWHFSVTGHQLGGLIGMQNGGMAGGSWYTSPWRRALLARASGGPLGGALRKVVRAKAPKLRRQAVSAVLKRVKALDLPAKLAKALERHSGQAAIFGDYADRAATLATTDANGDPVEGSFKGKTQAQWLTDQLGELFAWRNALLRAREAIIKRRETIAAAVRKAREQLAATVRQLTVARKHPKANKALIARLTPVRDALQRKILPALTRQGGDLKSAGADVLRNIEDVQGLGSPMKTMKSLPAMGVLGGQILNIQAQVRDLTGEAPSKITDPSSGTGDDERVGLLEQLLREANLRTAVSERQFDVLRNMPPYGGAFKDGGVVPGPVGAPRMILAHGGETVTPVGGDDASSVPQVHMHFAPGTEWLRQFVRVEVEAGTRRMARQGARALPGRGGGLTR